MNPEFVAASYVHTIPEKLSEYFLQPWTNFLVIIILIIMFANVYMLKKLRKIKRRDYIEVINLSTLGIYIVFSIISSVLVSRLGPHGVLAADDCDKTYMFIPKTLFIIVAIMNVIYFVINIITKLKSDKYYMETSQRGYFAEEKTKQIEERQEKSQHVDRSSFMDNIKERIDMDGIKYKVNSVTEEVREIINSKLKKDE